MAWRIVSAIAALCLALSLTACQSPFRETIQGSGNTSEQRRLEFDEIPAKPLSLRVRGITVTGKLARLGQFMTITIYDGVTYPDGASVDPHCGRLSIETDDNINALINVGFDEAANEIVIEPARENIAFAASTMSIKVQMPVDNLIVEDDAWNVWYTGPARNMTSFNAELSGVNDSFVRLAGEHPGSVNIVFNGADGAKLECETNDGWITLDGPGSIALGPTQ